MPDAGLYAFCRLDSATGPASRISASAFFCLASVPVMSASPEMSVVRFARLDRTNEATSPRATARFFRASASSPRSAASWSATLARSVLNERTWESLVARAVVKICRFRTVENRSPRPSDRVPIARDRSVRVWLILPPSPSRLSAPTASSRDRAPVLFAPSGPSATSRSLRLEKIRSSSTGTAVSASLIRAPSASRGPFVYTGVSWTYRSLTTDGDTTTALASAGTE